MSKTSVVDVLRYAASGVIALLCLYIANPAAGLAITALPQAVLAGATLAVGALIYIVYRALVYAPVVTVLQDKLFRTEPSWRTELMGAFGISRRQAILLYGELRAHMAPAPERSVHFANAHFGYTAGIIALGFVPVAALSARPVPALSLLVSAVVVLTATFLFHRRGEDEELHELRKFDRAQLSAIAASFFKARPINAVDVL